MNDNEIKKALECCGGSSAVDCYDCPLKQGKITHCTTELATNALDLITRQKAEIEHFREVTKKIKSEAYKEFAERLNESTFFMQDEDGFDVSVVYVSDIDRTLKKLTEVSDNGNN